MKYLLDTCVISELVKPKPNSHVVDWLNSIPSERLFLSVVTISEVRKGITKLPDSKRKDLLSSWLDSLLEDYDNRIHTINLIVAENWGIMLGKAEQNGTPMASIDSLIAATAYTHNLVLITRNVHDFEPSNVPIQNPWVGPES